MKTSSVVAVVLGMFFVMQGVSRLEGGMAPSLRVPLMPVTSFSIKMPESISEISTERSLMPSVVSEIEIQRWIGIFA